jgi:hypothetical protein
VLVVVLAAWRTGESPRAAEGPPPAPISERAFGQLRLDVPTDWVELERADGRITWGDRSRTHTVTLASAEASSLPLVEVVRALARESERVLPAARVVRAPRAIDVDLPRPREDAVVLVDLEVDGPHGPLQVVQAWRRDTRSGLDVVATWTSADGSWAVEPRDAVPSSVGG